MSFCYRRAKTLNQQLPFFFVCTRSFRKRFEMIYSLVVDLKLVILISAGSQSPYSQLFPKMATTSARYEWFYDARLCMDFDVRVLWILSWRTYKKQLSSYHKKSISVTYLDFFSFIVFSISLSSSHPCSLQQSNEEVRGKTKQKAIDSC